MPRKSIADVLTERHGGVWVYIPNDHWECDDGIRTVTRRPKTCSCWKFGISDCNCYPSYVMFDGDTSFEVDIKDPRVYKLNGVTPRRWG